MSGRVYPADPSQNPPEHPVKFDWAIHVSLVLAFVAMLGSVATFDHDGAERRERLEAASAGLTSTGVFEYDHWREAARALRGAPLHERALRRFAREAARGSTLDATTLEGVLWYWTALMRIEQNRGDDSESNRPYIEALQHAAELLDDSEFRTSPDASERYLWGHYLGRAYARLGEPDRALSPLLLAFEASPGLHSSIDARRIPSHLETLAGSLWMIDEPAHAIEVVREIIRIRVFETDAWFTMFMPTSRWADRFEQLDREQVLELAVPFVSEWLDAHGEQRDPRRSYIQLGWMLDTLGRASEAREAWATSNRAWASWAAADPTPANIYNLACTQSLLGERARALETLARAVDLGFDDLGLLTSDRDLTNIRDSEDFEALVGRVEAAVQAEADAFRADGPYTVIP